MCWLCSCRQVWSATSLESSIAFPKNSCALVLYIYVAFHTSESTYVLSLRSRKPTPCKCKSQQTMLWLQWKVTKYVWWMIYNGNIVITYMAVSSELNNDVSCRHYFLYDVLIWLCRVTVTLTTINIRSGKYIVILGDAPQLLNSKRSIKWYLNKNIQCTHCNMFCFRFLRSFPCSDQSNLGYHSLS